MNRAEKVLKIFIIFWGFYLFLEGFSYLSDIRLMDTKALWLPSSAAYAELTGQILGSVFLLMAILAFEVQRNVNKYKNFVIISGFWSILHGGLLIYLSISQNYLKAFLKIPSLYVWLPFYNQYLFLEGVVLIIYSLIVYIWIKNK